MVIAKRPDRFVELVNNGVKIEELNVGNMSQTNETRSVTNSINITDEDVNNFKLLQEKVSTLSHKWYQTINQLTLCH